MTTGSDNAGASETGSVASSLELTLMGSRGVALDFLMPLFYPTQCRCTNIRGGEAGESFRRVDLSRVQPLGHQFEPDVGQFTFDLHGHDRFHIRNAFGLIQLGENQLGRFHKESRNRSPLFIISAGLEHHPRVGRGTLGAPLSSLPYRGARDDQDNSRDDRPDCPNRSVGFHVGFNTLVAAHSCNPSGDAVVPIAPWAKFPPETPLTPFRGLRYADCTPDAPCGGCILPVAIPDGLQTDVSHLPLFVALG
jgi:hypothetical protein